MNLVVIVDRSFRGEVENRLARVGRYHPSRLVIAAVEPGRSTLDAYATVGTEDAEHRPGHIAVGRERIEIDVGPQHLKSLDAIVDPLLVSDLTTMVWAPHGHGEARRRAAPADEHRARRHPGRARAARGLRSAPHDLAGSAYVVDLAWLRSTPWRERMAASFDPPPLRRALGSLTKVAGAPPARLDGVRRAVLRLAGFAPGLEAGAARAPRRPAWRAVSGPGAARSSSSSSRSRWARPGSAA